MRRLSILAVSVVAVAAVSFAGGGSASAATLCSTNTNPCTGTIYGAKTPISAQLKGKATAVFSTVVTDVTCKQSTLGGETTNAGGAGKPVAASIASATFTGCETTGGNSCTVTAQAARFPWGAAFLNEGTGGNGSVTLSSGGKGNPAIEISCLMGIILSCTFQKVSIKYSITGGTPAVAKVKELLEEEGGANCAGSALFTGEYEFTAPKALFVVP